jgi:CBS-domain-containing membrane protein
MVTDERHRTTEEHTVTERRPKPHAHVARDLMKEIPIVIPFWMSVPSAAGLLDAAGSDVAPVVDADGRCVGMFTPADYRRWLARGEPDVKVVSEWQLVPEPPEEVCYHMSWRFPSAGPEAGLDELLYRLAAGSDAFLVVLDGLRRPLGIVCALDVLVADASLARAKGMHAPASQGFLAAQT